MSSVKMASTNARRRAQVEQSVFDAVTELMSEGATFTELPTQRIAERANIARSTLYLYFPDKASLLIRTADLATANIFRAGEGWLLSDHETDGPAGAVRAMAEMIATFREHRLLLRALGEVSAYDRTVAHYWLKRVGAFIQACEARLEHLKATGQVNPNLDAPATAHVVVWAVERSISHHFASADAADHRLAESLGRVIWLAIYGDSPKGSHHD